MYWSSRESRQGPTALHHGRKSSDAPRRPSRHSTPSATVFSQILPVVSAVGSHVQPETDCCTVCSVENLVTSDTKLEIPHLFYDGGNRTITVTSVSGPSCPSRFTSCWRIPPQSPGMMLLAPRTASQDFFPRAGTHRNQIVPVHHFLRYAYLRASVDGITNVCG